MNPMNKYICSAKTEAPVTEDTWRDDPLWYEFADGAIVEANNSEEAALSLAKELFCYTKENEKVYIETVFESEVEKWVVEVSISFQT